MLLTHSFILDELLQPAETKNEELSSSHIDNVVLVCGQFCIMLKLGFQAEKTHADKLDSVAVRTWLPLALL